MVPRLPTKVGQPTERFPCEGCLCGCSSAEYCWDRCCCHSDQEKLQWAKRNAVTPPEFLVRRVAGASELLASTSIKRSCCHGCGDPAPPSESRRTVRSCEIGSTSCDSGETCDDQDGDACSVSDDSKLVLMWKAAECRGLKYFWSMLAAVCASPSTPPFRSDSPHVGWIVILDERAFSRAMCPDPPVP